MYRYTWVALLPLTLPTLASAACVEFPRTLQYRDSGADVLLLQKVLNSDSHTQVAGTGSGSPGHEINFFGPATYRAVKKFQMLYRVDVLTPVSLIRATGVAGELTRKKLASLSCTIDTSVSVATSTSAIATSTVETSRESIYAASPYRTKVKFYYEGNSATSTDGLFGNTDPNLKRPSFSDANIKNASPGQSMTLFGQHFTASNSVNVCGTISTTNSDGGTIHVTIPASTPSGTCSIIVRNDNGQSEPFTLVISTFLSPDMGSSTLPASIGTTTASTDPKFYCNSLESAIKDTAAIGANGNGTYIKSVSPWNIKDGMTTSVSGGQLNTAGNIDIISAYGTFTFPGSERSYPYSSPHSSSLYFTIAPGAFVDSNGVGSTYKDLVRNSATYDEPFIFNVKNSIGMSNGGGVCRINPSREGAATASAGPFASPGIEHMSASGYITDVMDNTAQFHTSDGRTITLNIPRGMSTYESVENIVVVNGTITDINAQSAHPGLGVIGVSNNGTMSRNISAYVTANNNGVLDIIEQGSGYGFRVYGQSITQNIIPGTFWTFDGAIKQLNIQSINFIQRDPRYDNGN